MIATSRALDHLRSPDAQIGIPKFAGLQNLRLLDISVETSFI